MNQTRIFALSLGLAGVSLLCLLGWLATKGVSPVYTMPALAFIGFVLNFLRSPQEAPFPRLPSEQLPPKVGEDDPPKPPPLPPGTGVPMVFLLVAIGAVLSMTPFALCSCSPAANRTAQKEAQVDIEVTSYAAEVTKCRTDARSSFDVCAASAGAAKLDCKVHALAQFDSCACTVDAKYKHDAGVCQ